MKVTSLRQDVLAAYEAAKIADDEWQVELDRRNINRYTLAARGETGSTLRELYEAKIAADKKRAELTDIMRKFQDVDQVTSNV